MSFGKNAFKRRKRKPIDRKPELNPESLRNKKLLVSAHRGGISAILYHGNNENLAGSIGNKLLLENDTRVVLNAKGNLVKVPPWTIKIWRIHLVRRK